MEETNVATIKGILKDQRTFFSLGQTKDVNFRLVQLRQFKKNIKRYQERIQQALWEDLHKSPEEAYLTEISIVLQEIDYHLENLKKWAIPEKVSTPFHLLPSKSEIIYEPLGVVLIVAPWNYPFQLLMNPLVGAISAGCCAVLKPSPDTPTVARVMEELIRETFDPGYISLVQGGKDTNTLLLQEKFDLICFTGSSAVGKVVMRAAAEHLTPVLLELGGKSPCIVDADANIEIAAKRIAWGKLINAGQTCIAPDYLFVHESKKDELLKKIIRNIERMYGTNIRESRYYPRIVHDRAMERLEGLLKQGTIYYGGEIHREERFIAPTIIEVQPDYAIMQEEIFGPILPVMTFRHIDEPVEYINSHEKPLAFYYFGGNKQAKQVLNSTSSGGACINDTLMHIVNHNLPFGGVGNSGLGKYHGRGSFLAFSNQRAVVTTPTLIDLPFKYVPFRYFNWLKRII